MDDIELYGAQTGNSLRAAIALEEAGVAYRVKRIDLRKGEHRSAEYRALNPRAQVPIVVTTAADGSRRVLTQSNAIMLFADELAPGKLLPRQEKQGGSGLSNGISTSSPMSSRRAMQRSRSQRSAADRRARRR